MSDALQKAFPGVAFAFSQYIQDNVQEAASGIDAENAIKISGTDLNVLHKLSVEIRRVLEGVNGITDIAVPPLLGQPTISIDIDRERAARYNLSPGDINATIQAAVGGQAAGDLYENGSDRHFPLLVRLAPQYRQNMEALRRIAIGAPSASGGVVQVPLSRGRHSRAGQRRVLHLPRAAGAFRPGEVQRARPRSRQRRAGGAAAGRREGHAAQRLSDSNGPAISPISRAPSIDCRSPCRSPSR